jgi:hypothetical protein
MGSRNLSKTLEKSSSSPCGAGVEEFHQAKDRPTSRSAPPGKRNTCYAWAGGTFFRCLRKVPPAHLQRVCIPWIGISKFQQIFLLNPNLLLAYRNRYLEGTDNAQKTSRGHPDFNSYVQNLCVFIFQTDGQMDERMNGQTDRQTEKLIWCGWVT